MHLTLSKSSKYLILRTISFIVLICFVTTNVGWTQPSVGIQFTGPERGILHRFEIPPEFGTVREIIPAPDPHSKTPLILHIQDAHGSYEAQVNIKNIIRYLVKEYGFSLILTEGAAQELEPNLFGIFKDHALNLKIADALAKEGELTGAELFLLETPNKVAGIGVEDQTAYADNLTVFRELIGNRKETQEFVKVLRAQIELLGSRKLHKELRDFLRSWQSWREEKLDLVGFLSIAKMVAERTLKIDLENAKFQLDYPMLVRYFRARKIKSKINFEQAEVERQKLVAFLESKKVDLALITRLRVWDLQKGISDWKEELPRYFLERFYAEVSKHGFEFRDYPALVSLWASLIFQSELEPERFFSEIEKISEVLFESLAKKSEEKELISLFKDSIVLEKLLLLKLSRDEYEGALRSRASFDPNLIWERLGAMVLASLREGRRPTKQSRAEIVSTSLGMLSRNDVQLAKISQRIDQAFHFYETAQKREEFLVSHAQKILNERKQRKAILVTGGFHSEGLKKKFYNQNCSYVEITPHLTSVAGIDKVYEQAVLERSQMMQYARSILQPDPTLANFNYRRSELGRVLNDLNVPTEKVGEFNESLFAKVYRAGARVDSANRWEIASIQTRAEVREENSSEFKVSSLKLEQLETRNPKLETNFNRA
ncbi:MAG: hypothetical protein HYS55_04090, partial [Candidatus Omnitrophica bacterium]|nr:hypothetical protein [Candidatus Omnitrophota bacterium]